MYQRNKGFEYLPAWAGALCLLGQPVVAGLLGRTLLGERLGFSCFVGAATIAVGLVVSAT